MAADETFGAFRDLVTLPDSLLGTTVDCENIQSKYRIRIFYTVSIQFKITYLFCYFFLPRCHFTIEDFQQKATKLCLFLFKMSRALRKHSTMRSNYCAPTYNSNVKPCTASNTRQSALFAAVHKIHAIGMCATVLTFHGQLSFPFLHQKPNKLHKIWLDIIRN